MRERARLPATGKRLRFAGQTIYDIVGELSVEVPAVPLREATSREELLSALDQAVFASTRGAQLKTTIVKLLEGHAPVPGDGGYLIELERPGRRRFVFGDAGGTVLRSRFVS